MVQRTTITLVFTRFMTTPTLILLPGPSRYIVSRDQENGEIFLEIAKVPYHTDPHL